MKLRLALRAAPLGIWDWHVQTGEMHYSPRARAIFGFAPDEPITYEKVRDATHPDDYPWTSRQAREALDPAIRSQKPYEYRIIRADNGEVRWALAYGEAVFQKSGDQVRAVRFIGTIEDITSRKLAEQALRDNELRQRLAIDAARMAVWEVDRATGEITASPELNQMFGLPADAKPSASQLRQLFAPGDLQKVADIRERAMAAGETRFEAEFRCVFPDGSMPWRLLRGEIHPPTEFMPAGRIIGVLMDIDERRRAEERQKLLHREIHHRVRNSLSVIQAVVNQTFGRGLADPEALQSFRNRLTALARATELVSAEQGRPFNLRTLLLEIVTPYAPAERLFVSGGDEQLPPRMNIPLALIFNELATNAAKFGSLSVPKGSVQVSWNRNDRGLEVRWIERGGPAVGHQLARKFGLRLILDVLPVEIGQVEIKPHSTGIECHIQIGLQPEKSAGTGPEG